MTWDDACKLTHVRVLALRASVKAGALVSVEQLRRAIDPICGDLLALPAAAAAREEEREWWAVLAGRWSAIDATYAVTAATPAGARPSVTVVTRKPLAR